MIAALSEPSGKDLTVEQEPDGRSSSDQRLVRTGPADAGGPAAHQDRPRARTASITLGYLDPHRTGPRGGLRFLRCPAAVLGTVGSVDRTNGLELPAKSSPYAS